MKMNIGNVSSGYHFINFIAAENGMSWPPVPQSASAAIAATAPIAPKTLWPVNSMTIIRANMNTAMNSWLMSRAPSNSRPLIRAMSLKSSDTACKSMRENPSTIMNLIGQMYGRQAVDDRSNLPISSDPVSSPAK